MEDFDGAPKVVGSKQTLRAMEKGLATVVFIAKDAKPGLQAKILKSAKEHQVEIQFVESMVSLGKACNVEVKTATAAIIQ